MSRLWQEIKRRRVLGGVLKYGLAVFAVLQVADIVCHTLEAPRWLMVGLIGAGALGLPVVVAVTWFFEWTPDGFKRASAVTPSSPPGAPKRRLLTAVLAVGLLVATTAAWVVLKRGGSPPPEAPLPQSLTVLVLPFWGPDGASLAQGKTVQAWVGTKLVDTLAPDPAARVLYDPSQEAVQTAERAKKLARSVGARVVVWGQLIVDRETTTLVPHADQVRQQHPFSFPMIEEQLRRIAQTASRSSEELMTASALVTQAAALRCVSVYGQELRDVDRQFGVLARLEPENDVVLATRAFVLSSTGQLERAEKTTAEGLARFPNGMWLHLASARNHHIRGEYEASERAIAAAKRSGAAPLWVQLLSVQSSLGMEDYPGAISAATAAVELDPADPDARELLAFVLLFAGKDEEAVESLRKAIQLAPQVARFHGALAGLLRQRDEAIKEARLAISLDPDDPEPLAELGGLLVFDDDPKVRSEGLELLRRAIAADPTNHMLHWRLGYDLGSMDPEAQLEEARLAARLDPMPEWGRVRLAEVLLSTRRAEHVQEARALLSKLTGGADEGLAGRAARALFQIDETDALAALHRLTLKFPQRDDLLGDLAVAQFASGDRAAAIHTVEAITALRPTAGRNGARRIQMSVVSGALSAADAFEAQRAVSSKYPGGSRDLMFRAAEAGRWRDALEAWQSTDARKELAGSRAFDLWKGDLPAKVLGAIVNARSGNSKNAETIAAELARQRNRDIEHHLYAFVLLHQLGQGELARRQLEEFGSEWKAKGWPRLLYRLFSGEPITEEEILAAAQPFREDRCFAHYFLGAAHGLHLLPSAADHGRVDHLEKAVQTGLLDFGCFELAHVELLQPVADALR